jgi:dGTPase
VRVKLLESHAIEYEVPMFATRQKLEDNELQILAPYAQKARDSRGRRYPDEEHPYRTAFQRDRDRIIHTTAFRRLEFKTQVFVVTEGDYYRTRLTHSLEVAQIGRTLARALGANEDLTEAICLVHDIGHTPFGHAGEYTMQRLMKDHGGFNHQQQSLRIVEFLEERFPEFRGLNLTYEVREGIVKHETEYDIVEADEYNPDEKPTLEAQLTSAADEIAYNSADLDDGLRAGLLEPGDLEDLELWRAWRNEYEIGRGRFTEQVRHKFIRWLVNELVTDYTTSTESRLAAGRIDSVQKLRAQKESVGGFSSAMDDRLKPLKKYLFENFYRNYRVVRMARKAEQVIETLFEAFVQDPELLPKHIRERMDGEGAARVVCDYVAGMTDRFALDEYDRIFDPSTRV